MKIEKYIEFENTLNDEQRAYLFISKNYINHLDLEFYEEITYPVTSMIGDESTVMGLEEDFMEAHHKIIANLLRDINKDVFKGDSELTLMWMEKELNEHTYDAFDCMSFY